MLDLFGGSGTTLIACEQTGRTGCLMELDPRYCDVIVKRYLQATGAGQEAFLQREGMRVPLPDAMRKAEG